MKLTIDTILDGVQIVFFLVTGLIAIFTYRMARKTVFEPLKLETFKLQLQIYSEILDVFNGKDETKLRDIFGISHMARVNIMYLYHKYVNLFYEISDEKQIMLFNKYEHAIITKKAEEALMIFNDDYSIRQLDNIGYEIREKYDFDSSTLWDNYIIDKILLPNEMIEVNQRLEKIKNNPLLPVRYLELINNIQGITDRNILALEETLYELAKKLPEKQRKDIQLTDDELCGMLNFYNNSILEYYCSVKVLLDEIRKQLKTEKIFSL